MDQGNIVLNSMQNTVGGLQQQAAGSSTHHKACACGQVAEVFFSRLAVDANRFQLPACQE